MAIKALLMHEEDQVATLIDTASEGEEIQIYHHDLLVQTIKSGGSIPFGHKVARLDIAENKNVRKYGEPIGRSTKLIRTGEHVHVHNLTNPGEDLPSSDSDQRFYRSDDLKKYVSEIAENAGAAKNAAMDLAESLVEAELRGVSTHGLNRLPQYCKRLLNGAINGATAPKIEVKGNIIQVDGNNGIGHHVARETVDQLIQIAKLQGVAVAVVHDSNHFGFAGYYATRIAENNMIGIVTSNGTPIISVPHGKAPFFSNNPLAIAAPVNGEEYVEMDVSLSVTSRGRVMQAMENNRLIPEGWANGPDGKPTINAKSALEGSMNPLGGERGFALLFALEILSGLLSGGSTADEVVSKDSGNTPEGTCHFFMAFQIEAFMQPSFFQSRMIDLIARMREVPQTEGATKVRYPGERRWQCRKKRLVEGIPLSTGLVQKLETLAHELYVPFPEGVLKHVE